MRYLARVPAAAQHVAWPVVAIGLPFLSALVLVPLRDSVQTANIALTMVTVVVLVAALAGRRSGAAAAVVSALAFDVFHTEPYLHLRIASRDDVETTVLLLAVGLTVGHIAAGARESRSTAVALRGEVRRIYRIAKLAARGEDVSDVIMATQAELTGMLGLRDCRFEAPPFGTALDRIERNGLVAHGRYEPGADGFELPAAGLELPVMGRGHVVGRFVLEPTAAVGVSLEQRVVAVALADLVGAALAAPQHTTERRHG